MTAAIGSVRPAPDHAPPPMPQPKTWHTVNILIASPVTGRALAACDITSGANSELDLVADILSLLGSYFEVVEVPT